VRVPDHRETVARIASELAKLAREAENASLPLLAYLIESALLEANQAAGKQD
jgi:hypothetical protein